MQIDNTAFNYEQFNGTVHMFRAFSPGSTIDKVRELCILSVANLHKLRFWVNDQSDLDLIPDSISEHENVTLSVVNGTLKTYYTVEDAKKLYEVTPQYQKHYGNKLTIYSDIVRLEILATYGGWWLDDDIILMRPIPSDICTETFMCGSEYNWQSSYKYTYRPSNYVMYQSKVINREGVLIPLQITQAGEIFEHGIKLLSKNKPSEICYPEFGLELCRRVEDGRLSTKSVLSPHLFMSPFSVNRDEFFETINFNTVSRLCDTIGLHISGMIDRINNDMSTVATMLYCVKNDEIPSYDNLINYMKIANPDFMSYVADYRKNAKHIEMIEWNQLKKQYDAVQ